MVAKGHNFCKVWISLLSFFFSYKEEIDYLDVSVKAHGLRRLDSIKKPEHMVTLINLMKRLNFQITVMNNK